MTQNPNNTLWNRYQKYYSEYPNLGLALDLSRMNFADDFFPSMETRMQKALAGMAELEKGAIANTDEKRMVGHYWLRNPSLAPNQGIRAEIEDTVSAIKNFASKVLNGKITGAGGAFRNILIVGIGGSALGPQFVSNALGRPGADKLGIYFLDNTDPDGFDRVFGQVGHDLARTLTIVISKSGGTKETRNGMLETEAAYKRNNLDFPRHTVAITSRGSELDKLAVSQGWLERFPMWDWVGGRTSELSAVGLLPAALQGFDIDSLLAGAAACDQATRSTDILKNPAAKLALMWYYAGNGNGDKNLVVLPYKDRLELFSKYLQQLIMESLGKERDLNGKVVNQGLMVLGNKGSSDQHSYVQQLRDGINNFFVTFVEVLADRNGPSLQVEPGTTAGDYLLGFLYGTRKALYENGRESLTITITEVSPFSIGVLIALFERTVGLYGSLININPYHQPGVEAGKKAATAILQLQSRTLEYLDQNRSRQLTAGEIAEGLGLPEEVEQIYHICRHLSANPERQVFMSSGTPAETRFYRE